MKFKLKEVKICALLLTSCYSLLTAVSFVPYYDFQFSQGVTIPSRGDWSFSISLINDIGLITKLHQKHALIGFYELKYLGPGLKRQEGERFTDRYMDNIFVLRHQWYYLQNLTFRTQLDYQKQNYRSGANEAWGYGLYDYNRYGGLIGVEKVFNKFTLETILRYYFLDFPNYTDLLKEFQAGATEVESEAGKQNHHLIQLLGNVTYKENKFIASFTFQAYTKQKIITNTVQPNGTYYSADLQRDIIIGLGVERIQPIISKLVSVPTVTFKHRASNQNYQHFTTAGSTIPVSYQAKYYDYSQIILGTSFIYSLSEKWQFLVVPEIDYKVYLNRPPRDKENNFIEGEKQNNLLLLLTLGFNKRRSDTSITTFFYTYQQQTSNMKFEKYLPYNYSGHFIGLKYSLKY